MVSSMQPFQLWQYKLLFQRKIRNAYGTAFQDFFSTVMEKLHGDDFIRVRPFGKLEDAPPNAAKIVKKLEDDYGLAAFHLVAVMKEWHFAHNLVNGLPMEAVTKIERMKTTFPQHQFGTIGPVGTRRAGA